MARVKTFTDGGKLFASDLNEIQDAYEEEFATYRTVVEHAGYASETNANGTTYFLGESVAHFGFYLNPADEVSTGRTVKGRLRAHVITNAVAPAANIVVALLPITAWSSGSAGSATVPGAFGAALNTITFATPGASTATQSVSVSDFTISPAGFYCLAFTVSATPAAGAIALIRAELQLRQV